MARAFLGAALAARQQAAQPAIGGAVGREAEQARRVRQIEAAADDEAEVELLGGGMGAHHAGERVAVGDGDGAVAELARAQHQLGRMRGAAQEGEIGGDLQLGIGGHDADLQRKLVRLPPNL